MRNTLSIVFFAIVLPISSVVTLSELNRTVSELNEFSDFPYIRHYHQDNPKDCKRRAKCQALENNYKCMGAKLPYHSTTLELTDLSSQDKVQEKLHLYEQYLRYIPKCWEVIQPFLCALYMPKCDSEKGMVDLPSREMCKNTLQPCKIIYNSTVFPKFFNCEDERLFPSKCGNDVFQVKFNTTGYCLDPLVKTEKPDWWMKDIEGCGLKCKDSKFSDSEHANIHSFIAYGALIGFLSNMFTVITFRIDWKAANRYPAIGIYYTNICFAISNVGYIIQFLGQEVRNQIVCKEDGTLRKSEPSGTETLSCTAIFVMVYYFLFAGLVWLMIFSYAWYMSSLQALGKVQERVDKKKAYFHLVAWSLPLMLTITTLTIQEIEGDYITGICFIGFNNLAARASLFLAPLAVIILISIYIIIRGLIILIKVKSESKEVISRHAKSRITSNIIRITLFTIAMVTFCIITILYHIYVESNRHLWYSSLESYILCKLTSFSTDYAHCTQSDRPSVAMLQLQIIATFGKGSAMILWLFCDATLHAWERFIRKIFRCEVEEPMKIQKHQIIARAFAGRKKFNEGDRFSIFTQNHTDPVGLQIDLNSAASNEYSTTWANNLPRLLIRRPAVPNAMGADSNHSQSIDSDFSVNYRHVSIESRRNSGDSQVSVQIAELKATKRVKARRARRKEKYHSRNTGFEGHSRNIDNSSRAQSPAGVKRGSSTSLDSHMHLINALTNGGNVGKFAPNLSRRTATAGLDGAHIEQLLSNGKFVLPPAPLTGSEDENVSLTISETAVNMRLANPNLDLNDRFTISQLRHGLHIKHVSSSESEQEEKRSSKDRDREKRYSKSGRDSHSSKRSKRSRRSRKKYSSSETESRDDIQQKTHSDSSSCAEIKQLQNVQSSLNSTVSVGFEKNRSSRQSKTSMDVGVQANAHDLDLEMNNKKNEHEKLTKSKQAKTRENKRYRQASKYNNSDVDLSKNVDRSRKSEEKYRHEGTGDEKRELFKDSEKDYTDFTDEDHLIMEKNKVYMKKSKDVGTKY